MTQASAPPINVEAEQAVLGAMMLEQRNIAAVAPMLRDTDFYADGHRVLFSAILRLYQAQEPADLVTLSARLGPGGLRQVGGESYLVELQSAASFAVAHHARLVRGKAVQRELIRFAQQLQADAQTWQPEAEGALDLCGEAQRRLYEIGARRAEAWQPFGEALTRTMYQMEEQRNSERHVWGLPSQLYDLDDLISGWTPSTYYILASRPSVGKSAFALQQSIQLAEAGKRVAYFSLEMSAEGLARRAFAHMIRRALRDVLHARLEVTEWEGLMSVCARAADWKFWLCERSGLTLVEIANLARRLAATDGLDFLVVDYLGLIRAEARHRSEHERMTEISAAMQALAKELKVPLLALHQLNRDCEREGRLPRKSDLRESGSLEQDADVIILLHRAYDIRTEAQDTARLVIVDKQRNGPTGAAKMLWTGAYQRFASLERREENGGG